jgi:hypothetical protein
MKTAVPNNAAQETRRLQKEAGPQPTKLSGFGVPIM